MHILRKRRDVRKGLTPSKAELALAVSENVRSRAPKQTRFSPTPHLVRWIFVGEGRKLFDRARCRVSNYWFKRRPRWDGDGSRPSVWDDISEFVCAKRLPLIGFIRAKFALCSRTPIDPTELLHVADVADLASSFELDVLHVESLLSMYEREYAHVGDEVSCDEEFNDHFSSLFWYCKLARNGERKAAELYFKDAVVDFLLEYPDAYLRGWHSVLPAGFLEAALHHVYGPPFCAWPVDLRVLSEAGR